MLTAVFCGPASAVAQPAKKPGGPEPAGALPRAVSGHRTVVFVANRLARDTSQQVARVISSQLSDVNLPFHSHWVDRLEPGFVRQVQVARVLGRKKRALTVVWCSHPSMSRVFLFFKRGKEERILVRRVDRKQDGTLGRFEVIGAIVRSAVAAILAGRRIGVRPPPPPPSRPPRPRVGVRPGPRTVKKSGIGGSPSLRRTRPRRARFRVSFDMGYALTFLSRAEPVTHAVFAAIMVQVHRHWAVRMGYRVAPGITIEPDEYDVRLNLTQHAVRAGGVFRWPLRRWTVAVQASAVLTVQRYSPRAQAPLVAASDGHDLTLGLDLTAVGSFTVVRWFEVFGGLGFCAFLWNRHYRVSIGSTERRILDPFAVQPHLIVGLRLKAP